MESINKESEKCSVQYADSDLIKADSNMTFNDEGVEVLPVHDFFGKTYEKCASRCQTVKTSTFNNKNTAALPSEINSSTK